MGPKDDIVRYVERILHIPGRMIFRNVERFKIIVIQLNFRSFNNIKTQAGKNIADFPGDLGDRVKCSGPGRPTRQRDIDPIVCGDPAGFDADAAREYIEADCILIADAIEQQLTRR